MLISRDSSMVSEAQKAYKLTDELTVFKDWKAALKSADSFELMIVDLLATLKEPNKIAGYEEFAQQKMSDKKAAKIPLVLIAPPDEYDLDSMVGWPDFVFGHVRRPITMKIFRRISTWL